MRAIAGGNSVAHRAAYSRGTCSVDGAARKLFCWNIQPSQLCSGKGSVPGCFLPTELNLEGNYLHRLPEEVGSLPHLRAINLSRNRFQHFPEPLAAVGALETIELEENEIAGASRLGSKAAEAFNSPSGRFPAPAEH
nr:PREDICTED: leucine-rich repeat-containing protein 20 isoform X1 [Apteryx mantelli mantelli]